MDASPTRQRPYSIGYLTHGTRNIGGGEYLLASLIRGIRRDTFHPVVFFACRNTIIEGLEAVGVDTVQIPLSRGLISRYRDDVARRPGATLRLLPAAFKDVLALRRAIRTTGIDLLHPHDNLSKLLGGVAAASSGVPTVAHCHDLLGTGWLDRMLLIAQRVLMDRIIAVSGSVRDRFLRSGADPDQVRLIENGIDLARFTPGSSSLSRATFSIPEAHAVIGVIGMFDPVKGHVTLLKAIRHLQDRGVTGLCCLFVGQGRLEADLKNYVKEAGIDSMVRFLSYRRDIPDLIGIMDMVVMPSLRESFGLVALEAMAMNLPVIASRIGGLEEVVEHGRTGLLVAPGDAVVLADAIQRLTEDPGMRKEMGAAGRQRVESRFGLDSTIRRTEDLYLDLLNSGLPS